MKRAFASLLAVVGTVMMSVRCVPVGGAYSNATLLAGDAVEIPGFTNDRSLSFSVAQRLVMNSSPITGYPFTLSAWAKCTGAGNRTMVGLFNPASNAVYYQLRFTSASGQSRPTNEARNTTNRAAIQAAEGCDGNWHQYVAVFASATSRILYRDGVQVASNTTSVTFSAATTRMSIGYSGTSTPGNQFIGNLDEVGVWSDALTTAEVLALYNGGVVFPIDEDLGDYVSSADLRAWYRMGDAASDNVLSSISDVQGSYHMTPSGFSAGDLSTDAP